MPLTPIRPFTPNFEKKGTFFTFLRRQKLMTAFKGTHFKKNVALKGPPVRIICSGMNYFSLKFPEFIFSTNVFLQAGCLNLLHLPCLNGLI